MSDALSLTLPRLIPRSKARRRKRRPFGPREKLALLFIFLHSCAAVLNIVAFLSQPELWVKAANVLLLCWNYLWPYFLHWPVLQEWLKSGD